MDKMIRSGKGETIITNDGSTMLKSMSVMHPTAKMLVNLSNAQDVEAGDGTTSVVVICGSLLGAADRDQQALQSATEHEEGGAEEERIDFDH